MKKFKIGQQVRLNIPFIDSNIKNHCLEFQKWYRKHKHKIFRIIHIVDTYSFKFHILLNLSEYGDILFTSEEILPLIPYRKIIEKIIKSKRYVK